MNFQKLIVQADPIHAGKHPYHDNRYITTNHRLEAEQAFSIGGSGYDAPEIRFVEGDGEEMIVAQMRDCEHQAEYARLFAAAPELLAFVKTIDEMIRMGRPSDHLWNYCVENREALLALAEGKAVQS